jgi:transcriptional regulator with XRE-family HTH domain
LPRHKTDTDRPEWTPNQVVAGNLQRIRQRRGMTQGEVARLLSSVAGKPWSEAMVAHAERSVTGNRIREFTADDLVTLARAFDVPVLYFLTPPPTGLWVNVPGSRIDPLTMLVAVLGRPDNLGEWETLLDEWEFSADTELPFPLSAQHRRRIQATAREVAAVRANHLIRRHFKGNLYDLNETLRSLANLVLDVERHETLAELDEEQQMQQIEARRIVVAKGRRLAEASQAVDKENFAAYESPPTKPTGRKGNSP